MNLMGKNPEAKREERFQRWLSPPGIKFTDREAEKAYKSRVNRFIKTIKLEIPDRVPVFLPSELYPPYYAGIDLGTVMYDYAEMRRAWLKYLREFDMDTFGSPALVLSGRVLEMLDYRLYNWPRHGLPSDTPSLQYIEHEYMKADEYDKLILDPSDFILRNFLPRSFGAFAPFQKLLSLTSIVELPQGYLMPFTSPDVQKALQALCDAGKELAEMQKVVDECQKAGLEAGFPPLTGGSYPVKAPFDTLGDTLRGTKGILLDMYRQPDKILEALDRIADITISEIANSKADGSPLIMIPLHKGDDSFMSDKQFKTFYWPSLQKVILGLVNEGLVPMLFAEGSYNTRLEVIGDLPRGAVVWYFDRTDIVRAKETIGDVACIAGNIPSSLLITGTPQAVKEQCRRLIETVGRNGSYILASGAGLSKVNPDNLRAMMAAAREFGVYR